MIAKHPSGYKAHRHETCLPHSSHCLSNTCCAVAAGAQSKHSKSGKRTESQQISYVSKCKWSCCCGCNIGCCRSVTSFMNTPFVFSLHHMQFPRAHITFAMWYCHRHSHAMQAPPQRPLLSAVSACCTLVKDVWLAMHWLVKHHNISAPMHGRGKPPA